MHYFCHDGAETIINLSKVNTYCHSIDQTELAIQFVYIESITDS